MFDPLGDFDERIAAAEARYCADPAVQAVFRAAVAKVDRRALDAIRAAHRPMLEDLSQSWAGKYADVPWWLAHKARHAVRLGLDRREPIDILDIGAGAGHWCAIANALGHRALAADLAYPFYEEMCALLGVERVHQIVERDVPFAPLGRRFQLITIFNQVFDMTVDRATGGYLHWSLDDWRAFLGDLAVNHLSDGGDIYMSLNKRPDDDGMRAYNHALLDWAAGQGARVIPDSGTIHFRGVGGHADLADRTPHPRKGRLLSRLLRAR